jgi:hypothetical protein
MKKQITTLFVMALLAVSMFPAAMAESYAPGNAIADLNDDGMVDGKDLDILLAFWGMETNVPSTSLSFVEESGIKSPDVNGDGVVNVNDLIQVLSEWGPCEGSCPADINGNNEVEEGDLKIVEAFWGETGKDITCKNPDLNGDNVVNTLDLTTLLSLWGPVGSEDKPRPTPEVLPTPTPLPAPEPCVLSVNGACEKPTPEPCTQANGCYDEPENPWFKTMGFKGEDAQDVMVDGDQLETVYSKIVGKIIHNKDSGEYRGRIRVALGGYGEDGEKVRLRYSGKIDEISRRQVSVTASGSDSLTAYESMMVYDIKSIAKRVIVYEDGQRTVYTNAELDLTYNPRTGEVDVNSITGTSITSGSETSAVSFSNRAQPSLSNVNDDDSVVVQLLETHAMGFNEA